MYEGAALAVRRKLAGCSIFEAFNDSLPLVRKDKDVTKYCITYGFAGTVVSNNERQRCMKLNCLAAYVVKGANPGSK